MIASTSSSVSQCGVYITMEKILVVLLSLIFLSSTSCSFFDELKSEKMEFKCYNERCRVGNQFCLEEDQACSYCNEDVCNEPDSPSMCIPYCKSLHPDPSVETTTPCHNNNNVTDKCSRESRIILVLAIWFAVFGVASICLTIYTCNQKSKKRRRDTIPVQDTQPQGDPPDERFHQTTLKDNI